VYYASVASGAFCATGHCPLNPLLGIVQILAGLRKHVARSELEGSLVVVILNLKTAKLAGAAALGVAPPSCVAHESALQ